MEKFPAEVWGMMLGNLVNSQDSQNANNTCQLWRDLLQPSKASWMFGFVFRNLQDYLSVSEALKCREVCKHWLNGVDGYLLNQSRYRPTYQEPGSLENRTDERLVTATLASEIFKKVVDERYDIQNDMIQQVANYSSSLPLVGRWFEIFIWTDDPCHLYRVFLDSFGSHIWFLHFEVASHDALSALKLILEYLPLFPNLKRLRVDVRELSSSSRFAQQTSQQLTHYLDTPAAMEQVKKFPNCLETLEVYNEFLELNKVVLKLVSSGQNLQSAILRDMSDVSGLEERNIVDLSVTLTSYIAVQQMFTIKSPVRRLRIGCRDNAIPTEAMFRVAKHFSETLTNFHVEVHEIDASRKVRDETDMARRSFSLEPLTNREILKELKNVKRMTVRGSGFLSFSFLCGLSPTLEYLHLLIAFGPRKGDKVFARIRQRMQFTEELDLMNGLKKIWRWENKKLFYKSNVWKVFPKLREFTVRVRELELDELEDEEERLDDAEEFKFRRDVYDKLNGN